MEGYIKKVLEVKECGFFADWIVVERGLNEWRGGKEKRGIGLGRELFCFVFVFVFVFFVFVFAFFWIWGFALGWGGRRGRGRREGGLDRVFVSQNGFVVFDHKFNN